MMTNIILLLVHLTILLLRLHNQYIRFSYRTNKILILIILSLGVHPDYYYLLHTIKHSYVEAGDDQGARLRVDLDKDGRFVQV